MIFFTFPRKVNTSISEESGFSYSHYPQNMQLEKKVVR
ncbi:uncharacterized protein CHAB577_0731 [Chlamydia abortus]|nr:uncharacterized protein CHAB577_0731 [Chlamydia abortus]